MATPVTAILGLGREVGPAIARRFHEEGHHVIAADPDKKRVAQAREALPEEVILSQADLDTEMGLKNALTAALERFDRIDNAVIVPRVAEPDTLLEFDDDVFEQATMKALRGAALAMRLFATRMRAQEDTPSSGMERARQMGTITFVLSINARLGEPGRFTDSITQSAVLGAMRAGALELAEDGIRANAVVAVRPRAEETEPWLKQRTPLGRAALADEVADAALYLSSPQAAIITGATLMLDGGRSILSSVLD